MYTKSLVNKIREYVVIRNSAHIQPVDECPAPYMYICTIIFIFSKKIIYLMSSAAHKKLLPNVNSKKFVSIKIHPVHFYICVGGRHSRIARGYWWLKRNILPLKIIEIHAFGFFFIYQTHIWHYFRHTVIYTRINLREWYKLYHKDIQKI